MTPTVLGFDSAYINGLWHHFRTVFGLSPFELELLLVLPYLVSYSYRLSLVSRVRLHTVLHSTRFSRYKLPSAADMSALCVAYMHLVRGCLVAAPQLQTLPFRMRYSRSRACYDEEGEEREPNYWAKPFRQIHAVGSF